MNEYLAYLPSTPSDWLAFFMGMATGLIITMLIQIGYSYYTGKPIK